mmetsp:Transcript_615/g.1020  ORF Transcript_615/g.1020 Transcript_615/m.1020 type:complete len:134 (+) Transcript_615:135-536(+)
MWQASISKGAELEMWETMVVATMCDSVCSAITNPFDVVKARLMNEAGEESLKYEEGALGAALQIVKEEGPQGLLAGCELRVAWMTIGGIIFWIVLEESQKILRILFDRMHRNSKLKGKSKDLNLKDQASQKLV